MKGLKMEMKAKNRSEGYLDDVGAANGMPQGGCLGRNLVSRVDREWAGGEGASEVGLDEEHRAWHKRGWWFGRGRGKRNLPLESIAAHGGYYKN